MKALPSGTKVVTFSLATNRVYKDKDGNKQESTDFHNIVVFARLAELVHQYLKKGSQAYVEGRIQTRSWDDAATNTKKYRTEIVADVVQFGAKGSNAGPGSGSSSKTATEAPKEAAGEAIEYPAEDINPDDIPF